jgi:hypothetical protein
MLRYLIIPRHLLSVVLALFLLLSAGLAAADNYRFSSEGRVVAVGDIHGAFDEFAAILRGTGLVDAELSWTGGTTHLVSVGDLLHRGDYGRQVMDLVMRLQREAAEAGGAVHVILGNHEVMSLTGDLRYVSAGDFAQFGSEAPPGLPAGYLERRAAFAPDGKYGRWLLELPIAIVVDDTLFVHGGLSERLRGLTLEEINESSRRDVRRFAEGWHALLDAGLLGDGDDFDDVRARAAELARGRGDARLRQVGADITAALDGLPFLPDGPLWYRGSARCHPFVETDAIDAVLDKVGARRVAIGHTPTNNSRITSRKGGRVLLLDIGMNTAVYQGRPAALVIEDGVLHAWDLAEGEMGIEVEERRFWDRPFGMSDAEIEAFLLAAEVTGMTPLPGSNDGRRLATLELEGRRLSAVFNAQDTSPGLQDGRWTRSAERANRYLHEVAAYRLDRLIGLDMVPVTVARQVSEESGALRLWIEKGFSEHERQARQIPFRGDCDLRAQYEIMGVFDLLILNADPQLGLLRYDTRWMVWLMDQSRAFGTNTDVGPMLRRSGVELTPQFAEALARVTPEKAEILSEYLHRRQIQALVERASRLRAQQ